MNTCRFISWNINGMHSPVKRKQILTYLKGNKTDLCFLQETHLDVKEHEKLGKIWGGQIFFSSFNTSSRGVCILINKHFPFISEKVERDPGGRFILVKGKVNSDDITLYNIYVPNYDDVNFFQSLFLKLSDVEGDIIIGGDFNLTLDTKMDRSSDKNPAKCRSRKIINSSIKELGLCEIWRFARPKNREYSFFSPVHNSFTRIDYLIIPMAMVHRISSCEYLPRVMSDHAPISLTILPRDKSQKFYRWRINPVLLHNPDFDKFITSQIKLFLETNSETAPSPSLLWESLKAYLRGQIISFSSHIKKEYWKNLDTLEAEIKSLEKEHFKRRSEGLHKTLLRKRNQYNISNTYKTERALLRTRQRYYELGDKGNKLLAWQLKKQMSASMIHKVKKSDNTTTCNPKEINNCFQGFYKSLYSSEFDNTADKCETFLSSLNLPKLSEADRARLDQPLSRNEILKALMSLQSGWAPGLDGFTPEFYKKYHNLLLNPLIDMYQHSFNTKTLPPTIQEALITLICKPEKDPELAGSYRPISLLSVESKVYAKAIATRLEDYLPFLVHKDQTGFIKNRVSMNNLRRLFYIITQTESLSGSPVIASLDAEKAFDRVEWCYMFKVLECFGFGKYFIASDFCMTNLELE